MDTSFAAGLGRYCFIRNSTCKGSAALWVRTESILQSSFPFDLSHARRIVMLVRLLRLFFISESLARHLNLLCGCGARLRLGWGHETRQKEKLALVVPRDTTRGSLEVGRMRECEVCLRRLGPSLLSLGTQVLTFPWYLLIMSLLHKCRPQNHPTLN
jgi:hypothetical protein